LAGLGPGPIESGKPSGFFTSATGLIIYRGDAIPELAGDAIVADVGSNLVHRKKLRPNGAAFLAERAGDEAKREFLTSTDLWFRPVSFANGPDGALYIADMYREVVEHPWSLPETIKRHLDLNAGNDRGRIYRIVPEHFKQPAIPKLGSLDTKSLAQLLGHSNAWHRDTAARLLFERQDTHAIPELLRVKTNSPRAMVQALNALKSLGATHELRGELTVGLLPTDDNALEGVLQLAIDTGLPPLQLVRLAQHPSARVQFLLAWWLARHTTAPEVRMILEQSASADPWVKHAFKAALSVDPMAKPSSAALTAQPAMTRPASRQKVVAEYRAALNLKGDPQKGAAIFEERCATCHRLGGRGNAVGPDMESIQSAGRETVLSNIVDPNREVQLRYLAYEIGTRDGESVSGILSHESANGITLLQASGAPVFVPRGQIESFRATGLSLMPEGLENGLDPQAMADLLRYLGL
jgi:putative heme-binding domain-containing protein